MLLELLCCVALVQPQRTRDTSGTLTLEPGKASAMRTIVAGDTVIQEVVRRQQPTTIYTVRMLLQRDTVMMMLPGTTSWEPAFPTLALIARTNHEHIPFAARLRRGDRP